MSWLIWIFSVKWRFERYFSVKLLKLLYKNYSFIIPQSFLQVSFFRSESQPDKWKRKSPFQLLRTSFERLTRDPRICKVSWCLLSIIWYVYYCRQRWYIARIVRWFSQCSILKFLFLILGWEGLFKQRNILKISIRFKLIETSEYLW